jgi:methyl-accepting chemotaxis protein
MRNEYKRSFRNYLVDTDLQLHLIRQSLIYVLAILFVMVSILLYPLIRDMMFSNDLDREYRAAQTFLILVQWLIPAIVIMIVLFMGRLIVMTHRICGPLLNFTRTFNKLAEGDLTRKVYLRKHDYLKVECDKINEMIDGIVGIISHLMVNNEKLKVTLQDIKGRVNDLDTKEKIEYSLEIINQDADYVSDALGHFKVKNNMLQETRNF